MGVETEASLERTMTVGAALADTMTRADGEPTANGSAGEVATGEARFAITGTLRRGGMGIIHEADDRQFGRTVALKKMTRGAERADLRARFLTESVVTANLEHPGIVPVYERGVDASGSPFYAMRLVRGRTLAEAVAESDTLEERLKLIPAIVRVAQTLSYAHEHGVVHRDVKPDNVIVGRHGETILLDWGIAKVRGVPVRAGSSEDTDRSEPDVTATRHGAIMGTPAYMAPEQAAGEVARIDERTDVFALGALLYHVLTGRAPLGGEPGSDPLTKAREADIPPIRSIERQAPPALCAIAEQAMSRSPERRYQSATELARSLELYVENALTGGGSRAVAVLTSIAMVGVMLLLVGAAVLVTSTMPTMRELGVASYLYSFFAVVGLSLTVIDWRTRGRHRLAPLSIGLAVCTALLGVIGTFEGYQNVLRFAYEAHTAAELARLREVLIVGTKEAFGNLAPSATFAAVQIMAWALAARAVARQRDRAAGLAPTGRRVS